MIVESGVVNIKPCLNKFATSAVTGSWVAIRLLIAIRLSIAMLGFKH